MVLISPLVVLLTFTIGWFSWFFLWFFLPFGVLVGIILCAMVTGACGVWEKFKTEICAVYTAIAGFVGGFLYLIIR